MIKREIDITINLTAHEAAEAFCGFDSAEQAEFFHVVGTIANQWKNGLAGLAFQLQNVISENKITETAAETMRTIGEFGNAIGL